MPYIILLLPYAGFFLTRLLRAAGIGHPLYAVCAGLLLLALGTFDITRAFNYPAKKFNTDAFAAGWTLRTLQGIGTIPDDEKIIIEKRERWLPWPIIALANKPERFARLDDGESRSACEDGFQREACKSIKSWSDDAIPAVCEGGFHTQACKSRILSGTFDLMILSSQEKVQGFREIFNGRSWQIGQYHIFDLNSLGQFPKERKVVSAQADSE
jgi:hypothetical protein